MCIRFNTKSTDTSWCRKSLFDQIFQSNTVISVGQNFQKISSLQKLVRYFGIEWEYKKSHPLLNFFIWVNANGLGSSIVEKKRTLWACRQVSDVHLWCFWFLFKYNWTENATVLGTAKQTKKRGLRLAIHEGVQSYWDLLGHMLWELEISTQKCKLKCECFLLKSFIKLSESLESIFMIN